jgi:hypothetical protein
VTEPATLLMVSLLGALLAGLPDRAIGLTANFSRRALLIVLTAGI